MEGSLAVVFISVTVTVVLLVVGLFIGSALRHTHTPLSFQDLKLNTSL
jgi:hypothetical protein